MSPDTLAATRPLIALAAIGAVLVALPTAASAQSGDWVLPRLADGTPNLQGNWSNATMTPIQRPPGLELILTPEQVAALEEEIGRAHV